MSLNNLQEVQNQKRTVLCAWEIGGELGHITGFSTITKALEREGYHVVVALKDLSRAYPFFCDSNATLLQAPVWLPQISLQRPIACLADTLLLLGYLETDPLHALVLAWQSLVDLVKPDIVIFDYCPTAMLALLQQPIPTILVGTGFADPVPGHAIVDWRPYVVADGLVARQEQRVLQQINAVLRRQGKAELAYLADLFRVDRVLISTFPELDLYQNLRKDALYCIGSTAQTTATPVQFSSANSVANAPRILAYLKPNYPDIELLISALARTNAQVFIACPQGRPEQFQAYVGDTFQFSIDWVDLQGAMAQADLFVCHGNGASIKESLASGTPVVVLPIQLEQLLTGKKIQEYGLGILVEKFQTADEMVTLLNNMLANQQPYCAAIARLLTTHSQPVLTIPAAVSAACAELLSHE